MALEPWNLPVTVGFKNGFLTKQGSSGLKTWKKRWFVLEASQISGYDKAQDADSVTTIPLKGTMSVVQASDNDTSRENVFKLVTSTKTYMFQAENGEDLQQWMHALRAMSSLYLSKFEKDKEQSPHVETVKGIAEATFPLMKEAHNIALAGLMNSPALQANILAAITLIGDSTIQLANASFAAAAKAAAMKDPDAPNPALQKLSKAAESVRDGTIRLLSLAKSKEIQQSHHQKLMELAFKVRDATNPLIQRNQAGEVVSSASDDSKSPGIPRLQSEGSMGSLVRQGSQRDSLRRSVSIITIKKKEKKPVIEASQALKDLMDSCHDIVKCSKEVAAATSITGVDQTKDAFHANVVGDIEALLLDSAKLVASNVVKIIRACDGVGPNADDGAKVAVDQARESTREAALALMIAIKQIDDTEKGSPAMNAVFNAAQKLEKQVVGLIESAKFAEFGETADEEEDEYDEGVHANIWEVDLTSPSHILFDDKASVEEGESSDKIKAASLNALIERLTSEKKADLKFVKTFVTTYRSFCTPALLLQKLLERYEVPVPRLPPGISADEFRRKTTLPIQLRTVNAMSRWIESSYSDFDDTVLKHLTEFIEKHLVEDGHANLSKTLSRSLAQAKEAHEKKKKEIADMSAAGTTTSAATVSVAPKMPKTMKNGEMIMMSDPDEIARQMTIADFQIYCAVKPVELLNLAWSKAKYKHLAPNVLQMIERFNHVGSWVVSNILWQESLKARTAMYTKLLLVAQGLRKCNNFNSLLAVLAGFGNASVHRLKWTKEGLKKEHVDLLAELETVMKAEGSYRNFRQILHQIAPPCCPYLGMYLTDLTFMDDGNPDYVKSPAGDTKLINFKKREMIVGVISEIQQYQQTKYNYEVKPDLQAYIKELPRMADKEMYEFSMKVEPRKCELSDLTP